VDAINSQVLMQPNETPKAYRIRLYKNKDLYGLKNDEIGKLCNEAFGVDWTESAHRKKTQNYLKGYNDAKAELGSADQQLSNMIEENKRLKREVEKELKKVQTEKLEYNRWLREEARDELITEKICEAITSLPLLNIPEYIQPIHDTRAYALIYGDEHYGAEFELKGLFGDVLNAYSPEIFEKRMWNLFNQTIEIIKKESIGSLNVFSMGDFGDGCLRVSQLMKLRYGIVDGTIKYADFITNWLNELTKYVRVKFQMTNGNHTELRMLGQPKGTFAEDNMGKIVSEFIKVRLKDNSNFTYIENPTGYIYAQLACHTILGIHGEVKNMENAIKEFSKIYNVPIDYLIAGHLHHSRIEEVGTNSEVINVPSIVGVDPYSLSLNKTSNAAGKLLIFEQAKGKVCEYTLKLN
jgi:UDP-2,3-diacylglucosamine pyrophosphatase LpxH